MGSWYINRTFFFDVHPPLGKMLIALSGHLTGYDGSFPFEKPGDKYEGVNYVGMRVFCSFLGACIPPIAFLIVWEMTHCLQAASFSSLCVICDVGVLTLTQYILLDPILLFFVICSTMGMVKFQSCKNMSFSLRWWSWLIYTGTMLACALSVKFVGLFVVILIGLRTIVDLWDILGDLSKPVSYTVKHFLARCVCLIVLPGLLYTTFFYIHLAVLNKSGNGDGFYSSAFQSQLEGNSLHNASMPREVAFGSVVTLKNHRTGGGYLHSHWHLYPDGVGARQQQITTYTHKDENNKWLVKKYNNDSTNGTELLKHGDLVRLEHVLTRRNLHSHREQAPITKKHYQVTGYGENGTGDANDVWKVEIIGGVVGDVVTTVTSRLKLVHYLQNCILTTSGKQLPKWAYEQQEVSCNPNLRDKHAIWNVEDNIFANLPNVSFEVYAPGFFERLIESHAVMFQGNSGLKPKEGEITSRPWQWPINYRGQFFSGNSYRIYLLGNPIIWWSNLVFLAAFVIVFAWNAIQEQRGYKDPDHVIEMNGKRTLSCGWLFIGWLLHYVPFWAMGRVLYFHHYFPALLFSSMLTGVVVSYLLKALQSVLPETLKNAVFHFFSGVIFAVILYSFYLFSPLSYGMSGPNSNEPSSIMYGLKWLDSWEF
uniref:Protein O-mannosyl-transferase 2 n=2 Tax=Clastoptera arizonana TaxID=38151 RepID=A0A1B6CJ65_9HEMI